MERKAGLNGSALDGEGKCATIPQLDLTTGLMAEWSNALTLAHLITLAVITGLDEAKKDLHVDWPRH